ncbi:hypothetical protein [Parapedobacter koreensis]|uniref:hypothetical protein n=1 Tax=Parapedobacter koreensis TaxID=332977 RepID=UPI000B8131FB|nr:hypothetical protein [Parapedobacter koreensis]
MANLTTKWFQGDIGSVGDGFAAFGIGAASIGGGALIGAYSSAAAGPVLGLGNAAYFGDPIRRTTGLWGCLLEA